jgi:hypothetical protein
VYVENIGLEKFLTEHIKPLLAAKYPMNRAIFVGDPSGWAKTQISEESVADVFRRQGLVAKRAPTNDPVKRVAAVERLLGQQVDGAAMFLLDPRLSHLIRGISGGYKYKRKQDGSYEVSPLKDAFSHDNDALQYLALGIDNVGDAAFTANARQEPERVSAAGWT